MEQARAQLKGWRAWIGFAVLILAPAAAEAAELTISLADPTRIQSANVAVDLTQNRILAPFQADQWNDGSTTDSSPFSVGDGSHGAFNSTTAPNFHDGTYAGDKIIRINTNIYPTLNFTSFDLEEGWEIQAKGSKPLVIRSLSHARIKGKIDCSGGDGGAIGVKNLSPSGGIGRCGGGDGGRGASTAAVATSGTSPTGTAAHAGASANSNGSGGGGGGGVVSGFAQDGFYDNAGVWVVGAAAGTFVRDHQFSDLVESNIFGGSGGGGGHFSDLGAGTDSSGGGGGAGGGVIIIYAAGNIEILDHVPGPGGGQILANGGDGGGATTSPKGGGGGGGAGGGIILMAGGDLIVEGTAVVHARKGVGGLDSLGSRNTGMGGDGAEGRTWTIDSNGNPTGAGVGNIDPYSNLIFAGTVAAQAGTFQLVSKLIDLGSSGVELKSAALNATAGAGNTVLLEIAGSETAFAESDATWVSASAISNMLGKRYLRLRVTMTNTSATAPAVASSVSLNYDVRERHQFDFASCARVSAAGPGFGGNIAALLALLLMPLMLGLMIRRRSVR